MISMKVANNTDLDVIDELYRDCIQHLNDQQIYQWDEKYPNIETYKNNIKLKKQYIFQDEDRCIGAVILNEVQAGEWGVMPWEYLDGKSLIIHALAINPLAQGNGYGQQVLQLCETYGVGHGYSAVRLDVFSENQVAINLYEKNQYKRVGAVHFDYKPVGHEVYYCYEKVLSDK